MLNNAFHFVEGRMFADSVLVSEIAAETGTPVYIYSSRRILENYSRVSRAFQELDAAVHYSAKANANLALLRLLIHAGAGIDAVSGGEIYKALTVGCDPEHIVFAGVGKTVDEMRFALEKRIGWFNVENIEELKILDSLAASIGYQPRVALRLNPDVSATTFPQVATGHGGAKFGLSEETVAALLAERQRFTNVKIAGLHIHIGSQLGDVDATRSAIRRARELITPYEDVRTLNIGGGFPVAYRVDQKPPQLADFVAAVRPYLRGCKVIIEPGRFIVADAGILVARILYTKKQGGHRFMVIDTGMTELIRPALYDAHHEIVRVEDHMGNETILEYQVVGPVCETTDLLSRSTYLPAARPGDLVAILTAGAYGMVMSSNYNARPRPPEVVIDPNGETWRVTRRRETYEEMITAEMV
ncbi:MAG: diaminopimelate decarboxylase [Phototrophicales bacterium]|nr:MAG: diaminopimelate decarboxylase [Phototrophicales bacterium]